MHRIELGVLVDLIVMCGFWNKPIFLLLLLRETFADTKNFDFLNPIQANHEPQQQNLPKPHQTNILTVHVDLNTMQRGVLCPTFFWCQLSVWHDSYNYWHSIIYDFIAHNVMNNRRPTQCPALSWASWLIWLLCVNSEPSLYSCCRTSVKNEPLPKIGVSLARNRHTAKRNGQETHPTNQHFFYSAC